MADLSRVKPSKNFEDRIANPRLWEDKISPVIYRLMFPFLGINDPAKNPMNNDEYLRQARNRVANDPTDYMKKTVNDWTPEEWKRVKDDGFSFQDVEAMRQYRRQRGPK
jgi:hypothetical protein